MLCEATSNLILILWGGLHVSLDQGGEKAQKQAVSQGTMRRLKTSNREVPTREVQPPPRGKEIMPVYQEIKQELCRLVNQLLLTCGSQILGELNRISGIHKAISKLSLFIEDFMCIHIKYIYIQCTYIIHVHTCKNILMCVEAT